MVNGQRSTVKETGDGSLPQPLPEGKGFDAALTLRTQGSFLGDEESTVNGQRDGRLGV